MREDSIYQKVLEVECATAFLLLVKTFKVSKKHIKLFTELVPCTGISTVTDCMDIRLTI